MLIDTHCHLNFNSFNNDLKDVLDRARIAGVMRMVIPAIDVSTSTEVVELCQRFTQLFPAIGIHPNDASDFSLRDVDRLHQIARESEVVAIGEIGLDAYHHDVDMKQQMIAFEAQLDLADELDLPVLIHNREADQMIEQELEKWLARKKSSSDRQGNVGIMHSFSSTLDFANTVMKMGFSIGASGPVTFKNASDKREIFRNIPSDRLVFETDAPFLTPHPYRGKRNEPSFLMFIAEEFSRLWELPLDQVHAITTSNAARIFKWNELIL